MLKGDQNIITHDIIWKYICDKRDWPFIPTLSTQFQLPDFAQTFCDPLLGAKGTRGAEAAEGSKAAKAAEGSKAAKGAKAAEGAEGTKAAEGSKAAKAAKGAKAAEGAEGAKATKGSKRARTDDGVTFGAGEPITAHLAASQQVAQE
jgi:hypothetical protein